MSTQRLGRLKSEMQALVDRNQLPGVVTMVAKDGKVVEFEAAGKRDLESAAPMQKDSIFRIYSMSKPITGVAMMMLFEEGKWQLNDPVSKHIPEFANLKVAKVNPQNGTVTQVAPDHAMTMRELMSHSGGLTYGVFGSTAVDKMYTDVNVLDRDATLQAMIDKLGEDPAAAPARRALALQRVGRRAGLPGREAVGTAVPRVPEAAHLRSARHEGHGVLRAAREDESLRVVLHVRQGSQVRAASGSARLLEAAGRCRRAAAVWSRLRWTTCASARCC